MELSDFFAKVEANTDLEGVGMETACGEGKAGVIVRFKPAQLLTRLPVEAIEKSDWTVIQDVLVGKREPQALQHMTRVVGYFSRIENWNRSKIGEWKDRQKGQYAVV